MNDEYLWDRSGDVDPDLAELERILRPLAHDGRPLVLSEPRRLSREPPRRQSREPRRTRQWVAPLALAAAIVLVVAGVWIQPGRGAGNWTVEALRGTPRIGSQAVGTRATVARGDVLTTDAGSRARLELAGVGTVEVGPGSRVWLAPTRAGAVRLRLDAGQLDASISAEPGVFSVDTLASRAVDLGCKYTLEVDAGGTGVLHVTMGWVGLQWKGRESLVPAGAICATRAARGPGTPYFEGATPEFIRSVAVLDAGVEAKRSAAVATLVEHARPLDAITLWHLLTRLDQDSAARIYDRLAILMPPPAGVLKDRVLRGDPAALGAWWEALGLGELDQLRKGLRGSYR